MRDRGFFDIFKGKRVLVTGDTGFKGSWLGLWLAELGAEVAGFALPPQRKDDHYNQIGLGNIIRHVDGDIRRIEEIEAAFSAFQPQILFHLAAQSLVRVSYDEPKQTFDTNVGGSVNVLEAARKTPSIRSIVYVTSDKCYRNNEWVWGYRENDELGGHDPYSASKAAAEVVFSSYMDSFISKREDLGAASVRAGNVIGGGDWSTDRIVPDCMRALKSGAPIEIRNQHATRPWQHVLDPLAGYMLLAARLYEDPRAYCGAWNFGPSESSVRSVKELTGAVIDRWGRGELKIKQDKEAPHEAHTLRLNCDKARTLLNWVPRWNFDEAVAETVKWYASVHKGADTLEVSRSQIKDFMED